MKRFLHGALSHETHQLIADAIVERLAGKLFVVAVRTDNDHEEIQLRGPGVLESDWCDPLPPGLMVNSAKDEFASVHFQGAGYSWIWNSRLRKGRNHESFKHPHFVFKHGGFHIAERTPDGPIRRCAFMVVDDILPDPGEYRMETLICNLVSSKQHERLDDARKLLEHPYELDRFDKILSRLSQSQLAGV